MLYGVSLEVDGRSPQGTRPRSVKRGRTLQEVARGAAARR
jgi:hypothetical protein